MKYTDTLVAFREIPDEITLCINISGCPIHCPDCHSKELWNDIGKKLTDTELQMLIDKNNGISCVCIMGGDKDYHEVEKASNIIKKNNIKSAWYSGKDAIPLDLDLSLFDYIKIGPYISKFGPLNSPTTNQRLYKVEDNNLINITDKLWDNAV